MVQGTDLHAGLWTQDMVSNSLFLLLPTGSLVFCLLKMGKKLLACRGARSLNEFEEKNETIKNACMI